MPSTHHQLPSVISSIIAAKGGGCACHPAPVRAGSSRQQRPHRDTVSPPLPQSHFVL
eukprot:NODE_29194_length_453_cov_3.257669.p2 GENE.NODE_29194_length_453_cov_3.257669~~NODE_29194_length_453_cov_3.257669.p2  ORF type:complete len:57 (-),score=3.85 NODE_29194_length_453_cov_3.257669:42-212(-)